MSDQKNLNTSAISKAYTSRVQKEKFKHQRESRLVDIESSQRQENILLAMVTIRSTLRDLLSIDFGKRYHLKLVEDDWWGWARLSLRLEDNIEFSNNTLCSESLPMSIDFYNRVGYVPPWIGYYVKHNNELVASVGFKGPPVNNTIEIAYGVHEPYRNKGIGIAVCKLLVDLSLKTDPTVKITARTFSENNFSTRILERNNFIFNGPVQDPEDGEVFEWEFRFRSPDL